MKKIFFWIASLLLFVNLTHGQTANTSNYRDQATENLYSALKKMAFSGYTMFGQANAFTLDYKHTKNDDIRNSDIKGITGSNPAFVESDFMWYAADRQFMEWDMEAMRQAYSWGCVTGYCWHLGGELTGEFYVGWRNPDHRDEDLALRILADDDRNRNPSLDWFFRQLDETVIPVFLELGFPIVFRPFHEMNEDWFWWCSHIGRENYIKIFRLTVDYIREAGVKNVLYCWSPWNEADFSWYPGDEYVDILGYDAYEVGINPSISISKMQTELGKLVDYAAKHGKVAAWTEAGLRVDEAGEFAYPSRHPDYWTQNVWSPIKDDAKAGAIAWVMAWYNADWSHKGETPPYVPYPGMNLAKSAEAVSDFQLLYHDNLSIWESNTPNMYGNRDDNSMFILPASPVLRKHEQLRLLGGSVSGWFKDESVVWSSSDNRVAAIDPTTGTVTAQSPGTTIITISREGRSASARLTVIP